MSERDLWLVIYLAIVLCVLGVLWAVQQLALSLPSKIVIGPFKSKDDAEKYVREFEAALERDKDKTRNFLNRSTM